MTGFSFWSPTYFAFGRGAEARTGDMPPVHLTWKNLS